LSNLIVVPTGLMFLAMLGNGQLAMAQWQSPVGAPPSSTPAAAGLGVTVLDQAAPDECFVGIGSPNNIFPATSCTQGTPKVNESYVWGLAEGKNMLWYGTAANPLCEVVSALFNAVGVSAPPFETGSYVCEFAASNFLLDNPQVPPELGDWRPPLILSLNLKTGAVTNQTPNDPKINQTLGIRSAMVAKGVALLGGPVLAPIGAPPPGINLFAFNAKTGEYLGPTTLSQYGDIRTWTKLNGINYVGVENINGTGSVLRWRGNLKNPFRFEVVGNLDNEAAYVMAHKGRIFASTWRNTSSPTSPVSGLWMSPKAGSNGLKANSAGAWSKIFSVSQYESDPVTAAVTLNGALGEQGQYLYWGTMSVPLSAALAHFKRYPETLGSVTSILATLIDSQRAVAIFRCCAPQRKTQFGTAVELLYGDAVMPAYDPTTQTWQTVQNNMNVEPTFGPAGFGNPFNTYTWAMASFRGQLYVGTFDWSYLVADFLGAALNSVGLQGTDIVTTITEFKQAFAPGVVTYGADLWKFPDDVSPAVVESQYGVGNFLNYGVRTMVPLSKELFVGSANPMNLRTDPNNPPLEGYELLGLTP
jgi:hypothetical protein